MTLGAWAIIQEYPSLLGLIPMILYIILAFKKNVNPIVPIAISIIVGFILTGNGANNLGTEIGSSLSSVLGQIGFLTLEGCGLGAVLSKTGVSTTLCKGIVGKMGVKTKKQALLVLMICEFVLTFCIGSALSAAVIVMPLILPVLAINDVSPISATITYILTGYAGMLLSPFAAPNIMAMNLTGLDYPTYLLWGAGPYLIILLISAWFICLGFEKHNEKLGANGEHYTLTQEEQEGMKNDVISKEARNATIAFLITFAVCIAYAIVKKRGMSFVITVLPILTVVSAIAGKMKLSETADTWVEGAKGGIVVFVTCVLYQVLVDVIAAAGGFEALANLLTSQIGGTPSQTVVMLLGTYIGAFGINGGAAAQMQIIHELFLPMIQANGLPMELWAIVLVAGSFVTAVIYPNAGTIGSLSVARSKDFKGMMIACWISSGIILLFCTIFAFVMPHIVG